MPWLIDPNTGTPLFVKPSAPGGDDANLVHDFTNQSTVNFEHNLGKLPAVTIIDSAGDEVEGEVEHNSVNEITITFSAGLTGSVILN